MAKMNPQLATLILLEQHPKGLTREALAERGIYWAGDHIHGLRKKGYHIEAQAERAGDGSLIEMVWVLIPDNHRRRPAPRVTNSHVSTRITIPDA